MEFKQIHTDASDEMGLIEIQVTVTKEEIGVLHDEFKDAARKTWTPLDADSCGSDCDQHSDHFGDQLSGSIDMLCLEKDFILNKVTAEILEKLEIRPIFTPQVHEYDNPALDKDFSFDLSIQTMPRLSLESLDPVCMQIEKRTVSKDDVIREIESIFGVRHSLLDSEWVIAHFTDIQTVEELDEKVRLDLLRKSEATMRESIARLAKIELAKRLQGRIPDAFYQAASKNYYDKIVGNLEKNGSNLEEYCKDLGIDEHELNLEMLVRSGEMLRQGLALETLFQEAGLELTDDDIQDTLRTGFGKYQKLSMDELRKNGLLALIETAAKRKKALKTLLDTAEITYI